MDRSIWNFHLNELCIGVTLLISVLSTDALLKFVTSILFFIHYNLSIAIIQVNRRKGVLIVPILFSVLPKKIRNRFIENM
jgi:hypothetical protein